jgi:hypothetical protein
MGNLLLTFPGLSAQDFRPWVNEDDARSENLSLDDFAARTATGWKEGLESQGSGGDRIRALRDAADFAIYTPGSTAGVPLNVIGSRQGAGPGRAEVGRRRRRPRGPRHGDRRPPEA